MITGKHKRELEELRWSTSKQHVDALDARIRDDEELIAAYKTELARLREQHDAELSAALAGKIDAEAELSRLRGGFCAEPSEPQSVAGAAGKLPKKSKSKKD